MHIFYLWFKNTIHLDSQLKGKNRFFFKIYSIVKSFFLWKRLKNVDILFVGNSKQHQKHSGKYCNRFFYLPMTVCEEESKNYIYLCYDAIDKRIKNTNTIFYEELRAWPMFKLKFWKFCKRSKQNIDFVGLKKLIGEFLNRANLKGEEYIEEQKIYNKLDYLFSFEYPILNEFIEEIKPKAIIQTTYYGMVGYSLNIIGYKENIPTIDIQHGGQGKLHLGYSSFTKIPKNGYALLPNKFWCWDESSTESIKKWTQLNNYHNALQLGNPWLQFLLQENTNSLRLRKENNKRVLFTMQYNEIDDYILETIAKTKTKLDWWIRLHPRNIDKRENIINLLSKYNLLGVVNIEQANSYNLVDIMLNTDLHISRFSGAIIEASLLGVYSIIIDDIGVQTYKNIIEGKKALVCLDNDTEKLTSAIFNTLDLPKLKGVNNSDNAEHFIKSYIE